MPPANYPFQVHLTNVRALMEGVTGALLGACVYGVWAAFANSQYGWAIALRSGLAHATLSALLTFYGTTAMRRFYEYGSSPGNAAFRAFTGGLMLTYGVLIGAHLIIGTPRIAMTLAAGALPNLIFCGSYALLMKKTLQPATIQSSPSVMETNS